MLGIITNFKKYSFLINQMISRDFKVKYKRSVLGVVWSLLYPLLMMSVMAVVFSQMFKMRMEGVNYLVYLMTGLIMFNYFSEASNSAMSSVVGAFGLINKVYIPKYIFPLSKCLFVGINFLLTLVPWLLIIVLSYFGLGQYTCHINWYYLLLPYIFACLFLFTVGISFILSTVSVFLRDMFYIYGIVLTIWQYFTPLFYSITMLPSNLQSLFKLNPLYLFIDSVREIVLYSRMPSVTTLFMCGIVAVLSTIIGSIIFKSKQDKFIYYI